MFTSLLLPLVVGTGLFAAPALPTAVDSDPAVRLTLNNDGQFYAGERAKIQVRTADDGYLLVLQADANGRIRVLFPLDPGDDNYVRAGKRYEIRARGNRDGIQVNALGDGLIYAAVSRDPFQFDGFVLGDHWDYKQIGASQYRDPEPELTDLVGRMTSGGHFDYDVAAYNVTDAPRLATTTYVTPAYATWYDSGWCDPWFYGGSVCDPYYGSGFGISIGFGFGGPRRAYYDPYPYWYRPIFYRPYYVSRPYYIPAYRYRYDTYPNRYYVSSYGGSYRYRAWDRTWNDTPNRLGSPYRDRRYDFTRATNTVVAPLPSRFRDGVSTGRRTTGFDEPTGRSTYVGSRAQPSNGGRQVNGNQAQAPRRKFEARATDAGKGTDRPRGEGRRVARPAGERNPDSFRSSTNGGNERRRMDAEARVEPPSRQSGNDTPRRAEPAAQPAPRAEPRQEPRQAEPRRAEPRQEKPAPRAEPRQEPERRSAPSRDDSRSSDRGDRGGRSGGGHEGGGRRRT